MNILVCIKQVPDTTEIKIDPVTNTLIRAGVPSIVNPFDAYALEIAARIKDVTPGTKITLLSMGPDQAKEETEGRFDIIFCGKQAIDGDTAQVGPEIAEHLDYPQVTYAVEARVEGGEVLVKRETGDGFEVLAASMPCVVTVTKPYFDPRFPTIKSKLAAGRAQIPTLTADDLPVDRESIGLKGSPTKVKKSFTPPQKQGGIKISEDSSEASARKLFAMLSDANIIG